MAFRRITSSCLLLLVCILLQIPIMASPQQRIVLSVKDAPLEKVLKELTRQSGYHFLYTAELMKESKPVTCNTNTSSIEDVLKLCFNNQPLSYDIVDKMILIKSKEHDKKEWMMATPDQFTIKGQVTDEGGVPLQNVTISVKGNTSVHTMTDARGNYSLTVNDEHAVLIFSFVGYGRKEMSIAGKVTLDVTLQPETKQLEEVVIAYGTSKNKNLTNAVAQVKANEIEDRPVTNLTSALTGAAPGIQTTIGGGQPGDGPDIRIRGFGSVNAGNAPLYVVDGAPYDNALSSINPTDIESISILKDASSAALYGARAANGVILITTKKGKKNSMQVNANVSHGFSAKAFPDYDRVTSKDYYPLEWEAYRNSLVYSSGSSVTDASTAASANIKSALGYNPFNVADDQIVLTDGTLNPDAKLLYADDVDYGNWKRALERNGERSEYNLNVSGGSDKGTYYMSVGYLKDDGFSIRSNFERASARVNATATPNKWFRTGVNLAGTMVSSDQANTGSGLNENPFYIALRMGPIYPVYEHDEDGAYVKDATGQKVWDAGSARPVFTGRNVLAETVLNQNRLKRNMLTGNTFAEITILKDFKLSTNFSSAVNNYLSSVYDNAEIGDAVGSGRSYRTNSITTTTNFNQLLNYSKELGQHGIKVLLGHENYRYEYNYLYGQRTSQIVEGSTELDNFATLADLSSYTNTYRTEGLFSRVEYAYADRYLMAASFRRDGSSKFSPENRWGNFWSLSAGWEINKEHFFKADWVDQLKLRASYGQVGSDDLSGYYLYQALYSVGYNNGSEPGLLQSTIASPDLKWESSNSLDAAIDFAFFKNRLSGTFEVFNRGSSNLLFDVPLPVTSGVETQAKNIGSMYNRGIEIQLSGDVIRHKDFSWNLGINATTFKNKITKLPQEEIITDSKKRKVGHSLYDFWLRDWYGVNPANGATLYKADAFDDATTTFVNDKGDTVTTDHNNARYHYAGSAIPDIYGSITNTFKYKNFSLQFTFIYQLGGKVYNGEYATLMGSGTTYGYALHKDQLKRWQKEGDITDVPRMDNSQSSAFNASNSDRWLMSGSYLSLKSATLGYMVPKQLLSRIGVRSAQFYVSGENLFMLTSMKGMDPSKAFTGVISSTSTYSPARIISIGANFSL
ncbi:TonB-dependent receptor [[Flexibacter] sp. ATCC 35208]|uniref:TonB-dependent receptor n=1 Tax=[Flexibacter] sp. ATCC 35208 TaxID=1936242 RepID=UPI0015C3EF4E|nr:TonB-dependent receptor [[Flexibacter] sp. ATCC 35208]